MVRRWHVLLRWNEDVYPLLYIGIFQPAMLVCQRVMIDGLHLGTSWYGKCDFFEVSYVPCMDSEFAEFSQRMEWQVGEILRVWHRKRPGKKRQDGHRKMNGAYMRVHFHAGAFQSCLQFSFLIIEMYSLDVSSYSKALGSLKHEHGMCCIWWVWGFHSLTASSCDLQKLWTEQRRKCISQALDGAGFKKKCWKKPLQWQKISVFLNGGHQSCFRVCGHAWWKWFHQVIESALFIP